MVGNCGNGDSLSGRLRHRSRRPVGHVRPRIVQQRQPRVDSQRASAAQEIWAPISLARSIIRDLDIADRHSGVVDLLAAVEKRSAHQRDPADVALVGFDNWEIIATQARPP
jgi:hypothetical protein